MRRASRGEATKHPQLHLFCWPCLQFQTQFWIKESTQPWELDLYLNPDTFPYQLTSVSDSTSQSLALTPCLPNPECCPESLWSWLLYVLGSIVADITPRDALPHGKCPHSGKPGTQLPSNRPGKFQVEVASADILHHKSHQVQFPCASGRVSPGQRDKRSSGTHMRNPPMRQCQHLLFQESLRALNGSEKQKYEE